MAIELKEWDVAEYLDNEEFIAAYLEEIFADGDPDLIATAIGDVARARNISALARETNLSRDTIYNAFGPGGNPRLSTLVAVMDALGFQLSAKPKVQQALPVAP